MSRAPKRSRRGSARPVRAAKGSAKPARPSRTARAVRAGGLFHMAFDNSPAMQSVVRAADGVIVEVNATFLKRLGFTREQVIGKTAPELNFWVEPEKLAAFREELESRGLVPGLEVRLRARNGDLLTVLLSSHPVNIDGVAHFLSAGVDITARKAAEAALRVTNQRLRQSEEQFGKVFRTSPALVVITRFRDGVFVAANEAFFLVTGFTEQEVLGRTAMDLDLYPATGQREEFLGMLRDRGSLRDREFMVRAKDGRQCTLLVSAELIEIDGELHVQTVGLDITERKRAEEKLRESELQLRESEAKYRSLYDLISSAVIVHDETGILQVNPAALKLLGAARAEQVLGRQPHQAAPPTQPNGEDSAVAARRHMRRALAEGTHHFEWVARKLDGTEVPAEVTLTSLQLGGRRVLQAVITDLTQRKHAEAELQIALAKERELNQLKSDFVSLVSHEFRTPLEIIMSSADNLARYHDRLPAEKREQLLRTINKSVRRMSGMMEEVLVLGRLEANRMGFNPAAFDLSAFSHKLCDEIEAATGKRCPIRVQLEDNSASAFGDENVLRHIFTNLLSNAVKYSAPEQPVEFSIRREQENAICRVTDHGCGIPEPDQKRLFEAFHRGSNVRQIPGTGLGLLIVRRCVELHDGEIRFASVEGQGATFTVRLPLFDHRQVPRPPGCLTDTEVETPSSAGD